MKQSKILIVHGFGTAETGRVYGNWNSRGSTNNINPVRTKTVYLIFRLYVAFKRRDALCFGYRPIGHRTVAKWLFIVTHTEHNNLWKSAEFSVGNLLVRIVTLGL
jgi:hypothetical protein